MMEKYCTLHSQDSGRNWERKQGKKYFPLILPSGESNNNILENDTKRVMG
jgi:hypothetical protein